MKERPESQRASSLRAAVTAYARANLDRHVRQLCDLVRIPSVSAIERHRDDMERAAKSMAGALRRAGAPRVMVHPTAGNPVVVGGWPRARRTDPVILVYGHYDVQPADPLDQWEIPPFEPLVRDGRVYGRGASDNKGTILVPIMACEALGAVLGRLPVGVTFLIEGEEEILSPHLLSFMKQHRDELAASCVVSADSVMWGHEQPSLVLGCKGLVNLEIGVKSANADLHSGMFGGMVPNAGLALAHLITTMVTPRGEITIEGFEDGVGGLSERERATLAGLDFDLGGALEEYGVKRGWGEPDFEPLVRVWHRPTLELNGIHSGYGGDGPKAVIPAEACAKVSCRLVPGQTPDRVYAAIERHVRRHAQAHVDVAVTRHNGGANAFTIDSSDPTLELAGEALRRVYGRAPVEISLGATLPFASMAEEVLGLKTVMFGWQMPDEHAHAPNEFFRLANLERGVAAYVELLLLLAGDRDT